jgi:ATP-dependent DNA ligase
MKTLAKLQAFCAALGIKVETKGRASKEPYISALRDYHWRKDHPNEPLPIQMMPMLLGSWEDLDEAEAAEIEQDCHAWIVQPKLDGVRALLHIEDNCIRITSRTVSEITFRLSEFQDNLPHLTTGLSKLAGTILDGELVCPVARLDTGSTISATSLQATTAILATSPDNARRIQEGQDAHVRFHVFDILQSCGLDVTPLPLMDRQNILAMTCQQLGNEFIQLVPSFVVNKPEIHRSLIDEGGEGTVWKKADAPYEPGLRVGHWIKRKRGIEVEAFVTGFKPGTNGHTGLVGAVEFSTLDATNAAVIPIAWVSNWTDEERARMTRRHGDTVTLDPTMIGKKALIGGHDIAGRSGRYRHAKIIRWVG